MKATGIVRRIDDLGRVVIPKEIRRTMRIREGDPLEIYTEFGGEIVLKKYSPIGELAPFATQYADILSKTAGVPAIICDREQVIAVAGMPKREVLEKPISNELETTMQNRETHIAGKGKTLYPIKNLDKEGLVCVPIISSGDLGGSVIFINNNNSSSVDDTKLKLAQSAAMFLGKQMES